MSETWHPRDELDMFLLQAQITERARSRERVSQRKAEIEERDWIIHALAELPGFSLEQLGTGPAPVSFRYFRGGRSVTVTVSVEGTTP